MDKITILMRVKPKNMLLAEILKGQNSSEIAERVNQWLSQS
jgi:hypothetical protein